MQAHTKRRLIRDHAGKRKKSHVKTRPFHTKTSPNLQIEEEKSISWRDAFKEAFEDMPPSAVSLRGMRNREGWTQVELGDKIGVSQANLSKMESGKRPIGKSIAKRLADIFETDYRIFL
jgi:DNA-binding XRE family transcriptional regulator